MGHWLAKAIITFMSEPRTSRGPGATVGALRRVFFGTLPNPLHEFRTFLKTVVGENTRVLDIGCGRTCRILSQLPGVRYGVDLVEDLQPPPGVHALRANAQALPFPEGFFDVVYSTSVLEHVERPDLVFAEISRVLKPRGQCFILTPNKWDYVSIFSRVIPNRWHSGLVKWMTGRPEEDTFPTLYRANTRRAIAALASSSGMDATIQMKRQHPHYLARHPLLYSAGIVLELGLQRPFSVFRPWIHASLVRRSVPSESSVTTAARRTASGT